MLPLELCQIFLVTTQKLNINVERLHFLTFSAKRLECNIDKRDGHGKLREVMERYFVKSGNPGSVLHRDCKTNRHIPRSTALCFTKYKL